MTNIQIMEADWSQQQPVLAMIRHEVFIVEQQVPEELEWDGVDADCRHVLALDKSLDLPIGTGRLVPDGQIGRMAIRKDYRRQGIGYAILQKLIELSIRDGQTQVFLHAQLYAVAFYQKAQFKVSGETFMEAGIAHVTMIKSIK